MALVTYLKALQMKEISELISHTKGLKLIPRRILKLRKLSSSSFLGSTAQLRPWPPPQNPAEFL
jgi:hypothetical protein